MYSPLDALAYEFGVELLDFDWYARYNAAPTMLLPVITGTEPHLLQFFRWGLIPFWAKDPTIGNKMINARAETLAEKPAFKNALKRRRCLVPVDGFFEWKSEGKKKTPMHIHAVNGRLMSFAGLWEEWKDPGDRVIRSFTIITCAPNEIMATIHDRMPVIIAREERAAWLDPGTSAEAVTTLLRPCPSDWLTADPVSTLVNSPVNNVPEIIDPVAS